VIIGSSMKLYRHLASDLPKNFSTRVGRNSTAL